MQLTNKPKDGRTHGVYTAGRTDGRPMDGRRNGDKERERHKRVQQMRIIWHEIKCFIKTTTCNFGV